MSKQRVGHVLTLDHELGCPRWGIEIPAPLGLPTRTSGLTKVRERARKKRNWHVKHVDQTNRLESAGQKRTSGTPKVALQLGRTADHVSINSTTEW